jgi:hypothetical protein
MNKIILLLSPAFLLFFYSCSLLDSSHGNKPQEVNVMKIYSVNTDGSNLNLLSAGNEFLLSQTGDSIFFCSNNIIYCMNIDGTNKHIITNNAGYDLWFSSGKNKILFEQYSTGKYYSINIDGSGLTKLNTPDSLKYINGWDISPSVNKVVFSTPRGMFLTDIDGNNLKTLKDSSNNSYFNSLHFTPDGNSVIYIQDDQSLKQFNLLNGNDITIYPGTSNGDHVIYFEISSLSSLLFTDASNFGLGINLVNLNYNSTSLIMRGMNAHYSIDGSRISYILPEVTGFYVYTLPSGPINHTDVNLPGNYLSDPRLSPDNSKIIFVADSTYYVSPH